MAKPTTNIQPANSLAWTAYARRSWSTAHRQIWRAQFVRADRGDLQRGQWRDRLHHEFTVLFSRATLVDHPMG